MLVRCGRCHAELEVSGPGEFVCPACGTRNAVRGTAPPQDPFGVPDLGGAPAGPSPFGGPPPPPPNEPAPGVTWIVCPSCSWRFAVGDVQEVACPTCATSLRVSNGSAEIA